MKPHHQLNLNRKISQTSYHPYCFNHPIVFSAPFFTRTFGRLRASSLFYSAPWQIKRPPQLMALTALVLHQSSMFSLLRVLTCCLPTIKEHKMLFFPLTSFVPWVPSMDNESNSQPPCMSLQLLIHSNFQ